MTLENEPRLCCGDLDILTRMEVQQMLYLFLGFSLFVSVIYWSAPLHSRSVLSKTKINEVAKPNFVFILTDDQDVVLEGMSRMPSVINMIGKLGVTVSNSFVASPLCCPSRSSILTGQYVHNHGALNNSLSGHCSSSQWQARNINSANKERFNFSISSPAKKRKTMALSMGDSPQILVLNVNRNRNAKEEARNPKSPAANEAIDVSEHLQKSMLRMTGKFLNETTGTVDYKSLRNSEEYRDYCTFASSLEKVELASFSEQQLLAFFINIYNALTVHSICEAQKTSDIGTTLDVPNFWATHGYIIGGFIFTLDDIEHGVLRGNRPHPSTEKPVLGESDSRTTFSIKQVDPRIHFALNCGARSCPVVRVYNSRNLEAALEAATESYLRQGVLADECEKSLKIPQIMQWYMSDFAETQAGMLRWIEPYVGPMERQAIKSLLDANKGNDSDVVQYFYDWSLNKA